jgi:hypothetical protein
VMVVVTVLHVLDGAPVVRDAAVHLVHVIRPNDSPGNQRDHDVM